MIEFDMSVDNPSVSRLKKRGGKAMEAWLDAVSQQIINVWKTGMRTTPKLTREVGRRKHRPSRPGGFPAIDYGNLVNSLRWEKRKSMEREFYGAEYALYLNDSAMLNRPFIEPGMEEVRKKDADKIAQTMLEKYV